MTFTDASPVDDGWCLDEDAPKPPRHARTTDELPAAVSRASSKFEEAFWLQAEGRCPAFVLGFEDVLTGSFGDGLQRLASRLTPRMERRRLAAG